MRTKAWLALGVIAISVGAFAQDDDDLAPIAKPVAKPKAKAKPRPRPAASPVKKSQPEDDDLAPIAVLKGDLVIKLPQGLTNALVSIDGKDVGAAPLGPQSLVAGEHTVKVRRLGYADFVKKMTVVGGKTLEVEARLTPVSAVLSVTSDVPDAEVFINGRLIGTAPISELEQPAGPLELTVRKDGFKADNRRLTLVAGRDYPVQVRFTPGSTSTIVAAVDRPAEAKLVPEAASPGADHSVTTSVAEPLTRRWYFWAGVVAAVVGVTLATIAIASPGRVQVRPLDEATVCAPAMGSCDLCIGLKCYGTGAVGLLNF